MTNVRSYGLALYLGAAMCWSGCGGDDESDDVGPDAGMTRPDGGGQAGDGAGGAGAGGGAGGGDAGAGGGDAGAGGMAMDGGLAGAGDASVPGDASMPVDAATVDAGFMSEPMDAASFCGDFADACGYSGDTYMNPGACITAYNGYEDARKLCVSEALEDDDCEAAAGAAPCD